MHCSSGSSGAGALAAVGERAWSGSATWSLSHAPLGAVKTMPATCCPAATVTGGWGEGQRHVSTQGALAGAASVAATWAQSLYVPAGRREKENAPVASVRTRRGGTDSL